jgi:hypothetical protein
MKKYSAVPAAIALIIGLAVVAYATNKSNMPTPAGKDLSKHVTDQNPYKKWKLWPGKAIISEGTEPHGAFVKVYVNNIAYKSLKKMRGFNNNSIVLQENYTNSKKLSTVTLMYKVKGYNPSGGDWFWAKYDNKLNVVSEGKIPGCLDCHTDATTNDYVFSGRAK